VPIWLEDLGLVPRGEAGNYVEGGANIRLDGPTPLNTNGGQLSEGRLHGTGHVLEAIQQLRGTAGARQIGRVENVIVATGQLGTGAVGILGID
jgi:acetyl-CoA acetyltransferase